MRVLVATNHLVSYTGSEIVALELAEAFNSYGHECVVAANAVSRMLAAHAAERGVEVRWQDPLPHLAEFELACCLHHVFPLLLEDTPPASAAFPYTVFLHLSPYEAYEHPCPPVEDLFASKVLANSPETRDALCASRNGVPVGLFQNPAPRAFFRHRPNQPGKLERLLVISNHLAADLATALAQLAAETSIRVRHIGLGGERRRVTPDDVLDADAIVTIGKSTQYGIVSQTPVYCYDLFGGPGWLNADNFAKAEYHNFSGRCTPTRKTALQIVREIQDGFGEAARFASCLREQDLRRFSLDEYIIEMLLNAAMRPEWTPERRAMVRDHYSDLMGIRNLARLVRRESGQKWRLMEEYATLRACAARLNEGRSTAPLPPLDENLCYALACFQDNGIVTSAHAASAAESTLTRYFWEELLALPPERLQGCAHPVEAAVAAYRARSSARVLADLPALEGGGVGAISTSTLLRQGASLVVASDTDDPGFIVCFDPGGNPVTLAVCIGITALLPEANAETDLQLFFRTAGQEHFTEEHSCRKRIRAGYNFVLAATGPAVFEGTLRIDPGEHPGTYTVSSLTIFALPG